MDKKEIYKLLEEERKKNKKLLEEKQSLAKALMDCQYDSQKEGESK